MLWGLLRWCSGKESALQCRRHGFYPQVGKISWSGKWQPTPVFLPEESHGQRSLAGYSPRGHKESDMTEHTHYAMLPSYETIPTSQSLIDFFHHGPDL